MDIFSIINNILPEFMLFFCGIVLIIFGSYYKKKSNFNFNNIKSIFLIMVLGCIFYVPSQQYSYSEQSFINNDFTRIIKFFIVFLALFINYISYGYQKNNSLRLFEYPILTTFSY